jgi:penicillin-insensitive murein endopeptidase
MRRLLVLLAMVALGSAMARPSAGQDDAPARRGRRARAPSSISVGLPFSGRLRAGTLLRESDTVRYAGEYAPGGHFFGTSELVQLLERAASRVATRVPGARLSVGELSAERGGRLDGHRSHQNGRDVDIAFYMLDAAGRPYDPFGFAAFDRHGHGITPNESLTFDDRRNYELLARLVTDPDARVQYVFVANTIKARILREAGRRRASARILTRLEAVMMQPSHGHPHRNHFHVRIYCPPGDRPRCEDREPFHAWYPGAPPVGSSAPSAAVADGS